MDRRPGKLRREGARGAPAGGEVGDWPMSVSTRIWKHAGGGSPAIGDAAAPRRGRLVQRVGWLWAAALLAVLGAASAGSARGTEWTTLRRSVVDLEVFGPGGAAGGRTYGFALAGVPGIVASHRAVAGAERIQVRTADGGSFAVTEFVADDPALDLVVLRSPRTLPALERGSHDMLAPGQAAFVILPPSVEHMDTYRVNLVNVIEAAGVGDLVVLWGDISTGLPVADSLGKVVGVIEAIREETTFAVAAVPIGRLDALLARPDMGGPLSALAQVPVAPWTQPDQPEGAQVLGAALCRAQRYSTGLPFLARAVQQKPDLLAAKLELGMAYHSQKDYTEAQRIYQEVLAQKPDYARAHIFLGSSYFAQGQYDKAKKHYQLALDHDPGNTIALLNVGGVLFQSGDQSGAEQAFKQAIAAAPDLGLAHYNLAMLYFAQGRTEEVQQIASLLQSRGSGYAQMLQKRATQPQE